MASKGLVGACACGRVQIEVMGTPIASVACYCDDCQTGSKQIEALPNAPAVRDAYGGTAYVLYRRDRFRCVQGEALLRPYKIKDNSATSRLVASCCNSAMYVGFDDIRHWVTVYRDRLGADAPPIEMRICTRFRTGDTDLPGDVLTHKGIPFAFGTRLLTSGISMLLRH
jgi:hypothetical protein